MVVTYRERPACGESPAWAGVTRPQGPFRQEPASRGEVRVRQERRRRRALKRASRVWFCGGGSRPEAVGTLPARPAPGTRVRRYGRGERLDKYPPEQALCLPGPTGDLLPRRRRHPPRRSRGSSTFPRPPVPVSNRTAQGVDKKPAHWYFFGSEVGCDRRGEPRCICCSCVTRGTGRSGGKRPAGRTGCVRAPAGVPPPRSVPCRDTARGPWAAVSRGRLGGAGEGRGRRPCPPLRIPHLPGAYGGPGSDRGGTTTS